MTGLVAYIFGLAICFGSAMAALWFVTDGLWAITRKLGILQGPARGPSWLYAIGAIVIMVLYKAIFIGLVMVAGRILKRKF